jgi:peptidoglycan-N-acetylglucosamine deacetylase
MLKHQSVNIAFFSILALWLILMFVIKIPAWPAVIFIVAYLVIQVYGITVLSAQYFLPVKFVGDETTNAVALTFDDGPLKGKTDKILDILKAHNVKAAFFCIGYRVKKNPELLQRIHDEGHVIGNHSYWHSRSFDLQSSKSIAEELQSTDAIVSSTLGLRPRFFRPPYGVTNPNIAKAVRKGGYTTIGWSVRSFDTMFRKAPKLLKRVSRQTKPGSVILLHDYRNVTIEMLPMLLEDLSKRGLKIVRVDELLNEKAYV